MMMVISCSSIGLVAVNASGPHAPTTDKTAITSLKSGDLVFTDPSAK